MFQHAALIIDSDDTVRTHLIPALRDSLANGEDVLMVVSSQTESVVRDELGTRSDELDWGDPTAFYRRLGLTYDGFRRYLAEQHAAHHRVQVVTEPDIAPASTRTWRSTGPPRTWPTNRCAIRRSRTTAAR
jgi:hypothetical protein